MKLGKKSKVLALVLTTLMIISAIPFTASADVPSVTIGTIGDHVVTGDIWEFTVPYTSTGLTGGYVTLLAVEGDSLTAPAATEENIVFIDQKDAEASGSLKFKIDSSKLSTDIKFIHIKVGGTLVNTPGAYPYEIDGGGAIIAFGNLNGDKDGDGKDIIDGRDVTLILQFSVGLISEFPISYTVGDAKALSIANVNGDKDGDGKDIIDGRDVTLVLQKSVQMVSKFPVEQ